MRQPSTSLRRWLCSVAAVLLWPGAMSAQDPSFDLRPQADERTPLANPHKGWYHHFPDNHPDKYKIARDADLLEFPGMDHLYIRLAWSYLEPKEGQFDWPVIDRIIDKWTAHGPGHRLSHQLPGDQYRPHRTAIRHAAVGRRGRGPGRALSHGPGDRTGGPWEPVYDDPVFLAKLDRFLAAFAARYDGKPWLRYVDIGSIGDWGEGHSWAGSRRECGFAARMRHVDLHLAHFRRTQLVVSDDFVYALSDLPERQALHQHVLKHGISYRDDSILVNGYLPGTERPVHRAQPRVLRRRFPQDPDGLRVGALWQREEARQLGRRAPIRCWPSTGKGRPGRTTSAVRWGCCTRRTSATTATLTSGWRTTGS